MRDRFTRVLRGHIAIARAVFPDGTTGAQIDTLARQFLWQAGIDFEHGTGHGVGSYLSVHEGPARISKLGTTPLKRGMILSNEPGYYKTDAFGIRIENLELVVGTDDRRRREAGERLRDADPGADRPPPDRPEHAEPARAELAQRLPRPGPPRGRPHLDEATKVWLDAATAALRGEVGIPVTIVILAPAGHTTVHSPISFSHSSSVSTLTPCFSASASFEPAPGPATT